MNRAVRGLILFACAGAFSARTQSPATPQQPAGLESDWDIAAVLQEISAHATRVLPLLDRADARQWAAKGAPDAYAAQLQSSKDQAHALADTAKALAGNPEMLSAELQVLLREQGLKPCWCRWRRRCANIRARMLPSNSSRWRPESGADRDRLERYVVNLASEREKEYQVMDQEAQRCRALVLAPATPAKKKK